MTGTLAAATEPVPDFQSVFRDHVAFVYRALRYLGIASSDVKDVAQDVFMVVHRKLPLYAPRGKMRSWLFAICAQMARTHRRRKATRFEIPCDAPPELVQDCIQEGELERRRRLKRLQLVLSEMDDGQRNTFIFYEAEGMSMTEICAVFDCPLQTGYWRLHEARAKVRRAFGGELNEEVSSGRTA